MIYVKVSLDFPSHLSYKIPGMSSQYAHPALIPGPTTLKLALVSTAIQTSGSIEEGEQVFEFAKSLEVQYSPPDRIATWTGLIKRLKDKKDPSGDRKCSPGEWEDNRCSELGCSANPNEFNLYKSEGRWYCDIHWGFEPTYWYRGYVFYMNSLNIYWKVAEDNKIRNALLKYLPRIRYIGSADSLVTILKIDLVKEVSDTAIRGATTLPTGKPGIIQKLRDIDPETTFDRVNPYHETSRGDPFRDLFFVLPYRVEDQEKQWTLYERIS